MVMLVKVRTTILIEDAILKQAQQLGLNVSQYCENALKIGIQALTNSFQKIAQNQVANAEKGSFGTVGSERWWGSWDLNPGSPAPQAGILDQARRLPHISDGCLPPYLRFRVSVCLAKVVTLLF